jgi:hypothetical protein
MPSPDLLPGVTRSAAPRRVVCRSSRVVASARWRAHARDAAQLLLLGAVDWLFAHWASARMPLLDRPESLLLLLLINAGALTWVVLARVMPMLAARRIARSWSETEKQRLAAHQTATSRLSRVITKR